MIPTIKKVSVNKNHKGKTMHLIVEMQDGLIERLVDTSVSMLVMATKIVQELGIMHLVSSNENYKMASNIITK
jgi:hypothetical protein